MWRKIYNAIWADKARRAAVLTIIIALIVSGTALAILNTIGKSRPAQGAPDEQPLIGTEVADLPQESGQNTGSETESQPADERQTEQSGEQYETPEVTGPSAQETSAGGNEQSSSKTADTQLATVSGETVSESGEAENVTQETTTQNNVEPEVRYSVSFATQGGSVLQTKQVERGTRIKSFSTPYSEGNIFLGWYYDEALTQPVKEDDSVNSDLTLYAAYRQAEQLQPVENIVFAAAENVDGDSFAITVVTEDKKLDAEGVRAALDVKNLTDPGQTDIVRVTGADGEYVITGITPEIENNSSMAVPGFEDGCTYRITLTDSRLNFKNQPDTVREYNFTTAKKEVLNVSLNSDIVYIPISDLKNITNAGDSVETLSIALYKADKDGVLGPAELTQGQFDYSRESLNVGDVISIYAGLRPDLRTLDTPDEQNGDIAYVEITGKNGNRYSYKNAAPEDVIFTPDILPVSAAFLDNAGEGSMTIDNRVLDYSPDVYANVGLDSRTTVDIGDYVAFYSGIFGISEGENAAQIGSYGLVTAVAENDNGTTTIGYRAVGFEEVIAAMDIYTSEQMSGAEMIEGVDVASIERAIEKQAAESGFADEAAQYLASLALATDNFTRLKDNMNLEDYKVILEDGSTISPEELQLMSSDISVECKLEDGYPKATISTTPKNLSQAEGSAARDKGLSVELEVQAKITMGKKGSDNQVEITVSGKFTEEVGLDLGVSSRAVWKVWGIFPYIAEYRVTANIDVLNYTGIEVSAVMVTNSSDDNDDEDKGGFNTALDIADQIKELIEQARDDGEAEDSEENANKLVKRYSDMMDEESDWIKIFEQNIINQEKLLPPCLPIIAVSIDVDFVVKVDACVAVGFDFDYITGKRYTYTIDVFAGKVYNDTVQLIEDAYEFDFYVMGRLAVRAGLEFEFKVGVFSTKLASVGFVAEAGAYTKLWGYFYYELKYTQSLGKSQQYSGALLIDVGAYLDVALKAQALNDRYTAMYTLINKEWPLWSVGNRDSILDFTTAQEDMPYMKMKQHVRSVVVPDSVFDLTYLDLVEGGEAHAVYEDYYDPTKPAGGRNRNNFDIVMTNDKFSYDPQTNTITVTPDKEDKRLEGEMIITWNRYPLAFSSKPIQRRLSLYWDNLRDGYVIVPYTNGGTYINIINAAFEKKIDKPADPVRMGYDFAGWYEDEELNQVYEFPELMPAQDTNIFAKWTPSVNTAYRVEHYKEQIASGEYELADSERLTGTTDSYVTPAVKTYEGYTSPAAQEIRIEADGSTVIRYYYPLEWHTVTFNEGEAGDTSVNYELKYGAAIVPPMVAADGYTFTGWDKEVASAMGTEDVVYTAQWSRNPDTQYRVEYYVRDTDGTYRLKSSFTAQGYTGSSITADSLRKTPLEGETTADKLFTVDGGIVFGNMTVLGEECDTAGVAPNGKMIIKVNYRRERYSYTFDYGYDDKAVTADTCYEGTINVPENVARDGYIFGGWSLDGKKAVEVNTVMGKEDIVYHALWTPVTYTVHFDGNSEYAEGEMEDIPLTYDEAVTLPANKFSRENYVFGGWSLTKAGEVRYTDSESVKNISKADGSTVTLYAVWIPEEYKISYENLHDGVSTNAASYNIESETIILKAAVRTGYVFEGWYDNAELTGDRVDRIEHGSIGNRTFYADWSPAKDTGYRVEHYLQQLDGSYALDRTDVLTGATEDIVTPQTHDYAGFTAPEQRTLEITADGNAVLRYDYTRNTYTLTFDATEGTLEGNVTITALYGADITPPSAYRGGYGFAGWYDGDVRFDVRTMPSKDMKLTAAWKAGEYGYTVNYYHQNVDGSDQYTLAASLNETAPMDSYVEAPLKSFEGFTAVGEAKTITICTDESKNVVDYYYTRNQYTLSWDFAGGAADNYTSGTLYYGTKINAPVPVKEGYSYEWSRELFADMPAENLEYTAIWKADSYILTLDVNGGSLPADAALSKNVVFDEVYGELPQPSKRGYAFDGWFTKPQPASDEVVQITADTVVKTAQNHVLYAHYTPIEYKLVYSNVDGAENGNPASYNITTGRIELKPAKKTGFTFEGWYYDKECAGEQVEVIAAAGIGDRELYAKWREHSYKVVFHSNNGGDTTDGQSFTYTESKALKQNSFSKPEYNFTGWSLKAGQEAKYTDGEVVSQLVPDDNGIIHLYAVWTPVRYSIIYVNMDGAQNAAGNPDSFTVEDDFLTLYEPTKAGYTFEGWYTDDTYNNKVTAPIKLRVGYEPTFYAKWSVNSYVITFDSCKGDSVPTETLDMVYDTAKNLPLISDMEGFVRPGYTFNGWALENDGEPVYSDGATVKNLVESGNINLYAVWTLNVFSISYDSGTGAVSNDNPASYSIEDNDVILIAPTAKEGYKFLGWYEGDVPVSEIVKGTQKDYNLTAKWGHGGIFTLSYEGEEAVTLKNGSTGAKLTYKVTRTLPEGTQAISNPIYVYYRTVNGTAYGSTVDIDIALDKYHFKHVGGENVYLTFRPDDMEQTFNVEEWGAETAADAAASFNANNTDRYYDVELYKIVDTVGKYPGELGDTKSLRRTIGAMSQYNAVDMYNKWYTYVHRTGDPTISQKDQKTVDYSKGPKINFASLHAALANAGVDTITRNYVKNVATQAGFYITADLQDIEDSWCWLRLYSAGTGYFGEFAFDICAGGWQLDVAFPFTGGSQGNIAFKYGKGDWTTNNYGTSYKGNVVVSGSPTYAKISVNDSVQLEAAAAGKGENKWQIGTVDAHYKVLDTKAPSQVGISSLALSQYKAGEQISITVIYDEVIGSVQNVGLNAIAGLPIDNIQYTDGVGTNALTFTATITEDFEVTPDFNNDIKALKPVTGTVSDILGNHN